MNSRIALKLIYQLADVPLYSHYSVFRNIQSILFAVIEKRQMLIQFKIQEVLTSFANLRSFDPNSHLANDFISLGTTFTKLFKEKEKLKNADFRNLNFTDSGIMFSAIPATQLCLIAMESIELDKKLARFIKESIGNRNNSSSIKP